MRKGILRGPQEDEDEEEKEEEAHSEGSGAAHDGTGRTSQSTAATTNNNKQKMKGKKGVQLGGSSSYTTASCSSSASSSSSMPSRGGAVHWKRLVGGSGSGSGGLPSASPARVLSQQDASSPAGGAVRLREFQLKVVVLGESGVGKTCLIRRFVHDAFSSGYKATVRLDAHALSLSG